MATLALLTAFAFLVTAGAAPAFAVGNESFSVDANSDGAWGGDFVPEAPITLTRGTDSCSTTSDGWGNFGFDLRNCEGGGSIDLAVGDLVSVTDGATTKSHTITSLVVAVFDPVTNVVSGTAAIGSDVWVDIHGIPDVGRTVTASDGTWTTDLDAPGDGGATFDLVAGTEGYALQCDTDNDCTQFNWHVPNPHFVAEPNDDGVWGSDFIAGVTITLTRGTDSCSTTSDGWGNFGFDLNNCEGGGSIDLVVGDLISVTDGVTTKSHTVTELVVTVVDPDTNEVSGTAAVGSEVWVDINNEPDARRAVTATGGIWATDFDTPGDGGATVDLVAGTDGYATQCDTDNDCTQFSWHVPNPRLKASVDSDRVSGEDWAPNSTVSVTVDGAGPFAFLTDMKGYFDGDVAVDLEIGQYVFGTDGVSTKDFTIRNLIVTDVDVVGDLVHGSSTPGDILEVRGYSDTGAWRRAIADATTGLWTADFSVPWQGQPEFDIAAGTSGDVRYYEADGDETERSWHVSNPYITASVIHEEVWATDFPNEPDGLTLYYRLDDPVTPEIDFEGDMPLLVNSWGTEAGDRSFGRYDVQAGHIFTVRNRPFGQPIDGGIERVLNISYVTVTNVDDVLDLITGTADPAEGDYLCVWSNDAQLCSDQAGFDWNPDNTWAADFASIGSDVAPGHWNSVSQFEGDGDETHFWWNLPPWIVVELAEEDAAGTPLWPDAVRAEQWTGPIVYLEIDGNPVAEWIHDGNGDYTFELPGFDIEPGQVARMYDSADDKTVLVEQLHIDQVNYAGATPPDTPNTVEGTAAPHRDVRVEASATVGGWWAERWVNADASGDFIANFGLPGNGWREQWTADLGGAEGLGRHMRLEIYDSDNDRVETRQCEGLARIEIARSDGRVDAYDFPEGATVTLVIDDPDPGGEDYTGTAVSVRNPENPCETIATFDLGDYVVPDEASVSADDGAGTTATTVVIDFSIVDVNAQSDTVSGEAPIGATIYVKADGNWRYVVAEDDPNDGVDVGYWTADFSIAGSQPGEEYVVDIGPGSSGWAQLLDDSGNTTKVSWFISSAQFSVDPGQGSIWANEFEPNGAITISIDPVDDDAMVFGPYPLDGSGNFDGNQLGVSFEVPAGSEVTATDGTISKVHTVTQLVITGVDPVSDVVSGLAAPGSAVDIWVHGSNAWLQVTADASGNWQADFGGQTDLVPGSNGNSSQCDEDNDCTNAGWWIAQAQFSVDPGQGSIWANDFEPDGAITITVDPVDGDPVVYGPYPLNGLGNFDGNEFGLTFDIVAGSVVTVDDGATSKSHTVTGLMVTGVDPVSDVVSGLAAPGSSVDLWVHGSNAWLQVTADASGNWQADFGGQTDLVPGSNGNSSQCDEDNDCTNAGWWVLNPTFTVETPYSVWSSNQDWKLGDTISLTVDDPGFPGPQTTTVVPDQGNPENFGWWFDLEGVFEILPGHVVTVTDGETTKSLTVVDVVIEGIDGASDTVAGWLSDAAGDPLAGVPVEVNVDNENGYAHRTAVTEANGYWVADFAVPGEEQDGQSQPFDIGANTGVSAQVFDEDYDSTHRGACFECDGGGFQIDPINLEPGDVLISETDGTLWQYRPGTGELFDYPLPFGGVWDIQWVWGDTLFIANSGDGLLWALHLPSGELGPIEDGLFGFPIGMSIESSTPVGWNPSAAWIADGESGILRFDDLGATQIVDIEGVDGIVVAPDGTVYFTNVSGTLFAVDETEPDNYRVVAQVDGYGLNGLVVTPDGMVLATSMGPAALITIDPSDGSFTVEDYPQMWSPEDSAIGRSGEIYVIDSGYVENFGDESGLYVRSSDGTLVQLIDNDDYPDFGDTVDLLVVGPWVSVTKVASETEVFAPGEFVGFDVTVYNQLGPFGAISLDSLNDTVSGDLMALEGCESQVLESGASYTCYHEVFVVGDIANTVTAGWTDDWGFSDESEASASVRLISPAVSIDKTTADGFGNEGDGIGILAGQAVTWNFVVSNDGDVDLFDLVVEDDQLGEVCVIDHIAAGDSTVCTATGGAVNGPYINYGMVSGEVIDADGDTALVAAEDSSSYFGLDPGYVTDSSLCDFGDQFDLVFTPDMKNWPGAYKLAASNPGQFYWNTFIVNDGSTEMIGLEIPYPFVTQGAMPLHAYSGVYVNDGPCFAPVGEMAGYPAVFGLADYTDTNGDGAVGFGDVYVVEVPADAPFEYLTLHLDYGLKSTKGWTRGNDDAFNDPGLNPDLEGIDVLDGSEYRFDVLADGIAVGGGTETISNSNTFKNVKGFGGTVLEADTLDPVVASVELRTGAGEWIETMTTDEHGWYLSKYRHKGKTADYLLVLIDELGEDVASQVVTVGRAVKFGEASFFLPT